MCVFSMGFDNNVVLRQLRRVVFSIFQWARNVRLPAVKACVAELDPNKPTPVILRDPTHSSASGAVAVPESPRSSHETPLDQPGSPAAPRIAPADFRGRQLSESPSALAKQQSSKRLRVENIIE
jgi:hypothetical protein